jgi:hypothetical protein
MIKQEEIKEILSLFPDLNYYGLSKKHDEIHTLFRKKLLDSLEEINSCIGILSKAKRTNWPDYHSNLIAEKIGFSNGVIIFSAIYLKIKFTRIKKYNANSPYVRLSISRDLNI